MKDDKIGVRDASFVLIIAQCHEECPLARLRVIIVWC